MRNRNILLYPYLVWSTLFIVVPLLVVLWYGLSIPTPGGGKTFSFDNFSRFFEPIYLKVMTRSFALAVEATLICLVIGYPAAWIILQVGKRWKNTLLLLLVLPMWINFLLRTYAWMVLLGRQGIINQVLELFGLST
ncbi:MAG: ABC transporter permease, partial [Spirochaetales bacterium]